MSIYIDADALQKSLQYVCTGGGKWGEAERMYIEAFSDFVDGCPTADVAEVVRCKECKWMDVFCCCTKFNVVIAMKSTFFCALGERRDDGEIH